MKATEAPRCKERRARSGVVIGAALLLAGAAGASLVFAAATIKTGKISFTGTGEKLAAPRTDGAAINIKTDRVVFSGTGEKLTAPPSSTGPVDVRTPGITFSGTNSM